MVDHNCIAVALSPTPILHDQCSVGALSPMVVKFQTTVARKGRRYQFWR
ncbi:MAG: hypothetical protein ACK4I8_02825 [Armatimonadota bacterium]